MQFVTQRGQFVKIITVFHIKYLLFSNFVVIINKNQIS